ncbi:MAG TPA: OsmC family peroxiredoxin [Gemmatimonadaceae bacterium]|nr:OsmC family peroxiredoxin [Gemmatimonadaceae bacterium]
MPTSTANATWEGGLRAGKGSYSGETGFGGSFNFGTRFGGERGSNPEELLAAAHAACFSMALSGALEKAGHPPQRVATTARCTVEKVGEGFKITTMKLATRASVPNLDDAKFQEVAAAAKQGCPVSQALAGVDISLEAVLE